MIPEDLQPLVRALATKARANQVNWVPAADLNLGSGDDDVVVSLPDYSINIFRTHDDDGPGVVLAILDAGGKRIAGATTSARDEDYEILDELLHSATRKISGLDVALAKIKAALERPGTVGDLKTNQSDSDFPF